MKNRILQIMKNKGMSQQEFSRATGISAASLSSIFNGRTAPTMKHAEALHRSFPQLNVSWLLFGEGEMYTSAFGEVEESMAANGALVQEGSDVDAAAPDLFTKTPGDGLSGQRGLGAGGAAQGGAYDGLFAPQFDGQYAMQFDSQHPDPNSPAAGGMATSKYMPNGRVREPNSYTPNYATMDDVVNLLDKKKRKIVEIRIFFDDGTFETFKGND